MKNIVFGNIMVLAFLIFSCENQKNERNNNPVNVKIEKKIDVKIEKKAEINYAILFPLEYKIKQNDISFLKVNEKELGKRNNDTLLKQKCISWALNKNQIAKIFTKSTIISGREWHYLYNHYPCEMLGEVIIKNVRFNFSINAGSFMICHNKDTTLYLGCDDSTFFLDRKYKKEGI